MRWKLLIGILVILLGGAVALFQLSKSRTFQFFGQIVPRVNTSEKIVALTFDDGPTTSATGEILKVLNEKNVKATFFVIGAELEQNMAEGRKIVAAGHELGNHSYSHERMILVTPSFVRQEIETTDRLIRETGYSGEITFRPPFGKKLLALPHYLSKTGRKTITWDVEPDSYPRIAADSAKIIAETRLRARPGSIILLHAMYPSRQPSLQAIGGVIDGLQQDGYRFLTVSELLAASR
ncbi:MAG: polysaccharide deacetylase family protein [Acidobacteria bacterium]|nr:polysaccharide deacetylase family protein [Acidobacteriota bacterium]